MNAPKTLQKVEGFKTYPDRILRQARRESQRLLVLEGAGSDATASVDVDSS
jgi:hypothetical protein